MERERCDYLLPTVIHAPSPEAPLANVEYMFPFVSVVRCPQDRMLQSIGQTLVASAYHRRPASSRRQLIDAIHIDRLNIGPIPTIQLDWLQPHEGNIIEFLFRHRAFQASETVRLGGLKPRRCPSRLIVQAIPPRGLTQLTGGSDDPVILGSLALAGPAHLRARRPGPGRRG